MMDTMTQFKGPPVIAFDTGALQRYLDGSPGEGTTITGFCTIMDKAVRDQKKAEKKEQVYKDRYGQILKVLEPEAYTGIRYDSPNSSPGYVKPKQRPQNEGKESDKYEDLTEHGTIDFKV
ncbi:MAG: hypothetical protein K5886_00475 [Lachnospiraceae bacterium]|nr:hypothetical protein [Lachnospiraceae bacterium]